ncbi:MAG: poly-gamma-glutamate synthase PgsB [Candidatus Methanomethyliaceae archaeon]
MEYVVVFLTVALLVFYTIERFVVQTRVGAIPLRIAVTGTRGKSSVTRLIAAGLSAGGYRVVAKTTGSRAVTILPSGAEVPIRRSGLPNILEQKTILNFARRQRSDAVVIEVMSIKPENYNVELKKLIQPHLVVITNVRLDHVEALGESIEQAGTVFALGVPSQCRLVVFLKDDCPKILWKTLEKRALCIHPVSKDTYKSLLAEYSRKDYYEWEGNLSLALAVCEAVGIPSGRALKAMLRAKPDFGALKIWRVIVLNKQWFAVNAFAANDLVSTQQVYDRIVAWNRDQRLPMVGILNLRGDRADRTLQWLQALRAKALRFGRLFISGAGASVVARKLRPHLHCECPIEALHVRSADPEKIMQTIAAVEPQGGIVFGFGNIGGLGAALVEYWEKSGELV